MHFPHMVQTPTPANLRSRVRSITFSKTDHVKVKLTSEVALQILI